MISPVLVRLLMGDQHNNTQQTKTVSKTNNYKKILTAHRIRYVGPNVRVMEVKRRILKRHTEFFHWTRKPRCTFDPARGDEWDQLWKM